MTLGELYAAAAGLIYGDVNASPPPAAETEKIKTFILQRHLDVQLGYNYWFSHVSGNVDITAGQKTYAWPKDFKEPAMTFGLETPFRPIPGGFELKREPAEDGSIAIDYWKLFSAADVWDEDFFDAVTDHLKFEIIYRVVADVFVARSQTAEAAMYYQKADEAKRKAEERDYHFRQKQEEIF